jgi:hypothetical protein
MMVWLGALKLKVAFAVMDVLMTSETAADVLAVKVVLPAKVAVTPCVPAVSIDVV